MDKNLLESVYRDHHVRGDRYGYLYCHGARGSYLKKWVGTGKKVLDLGCRDGMLSAFYAEGNDCTGVDIDQEALSLAKSRLNIKTFWLDLNEEWPFAKESFDVIIACEILEHIFFLSPLLERIAASLKPGGLFIGSVPNAFRMKNRFRFLLGNPYENDPTHVRQFSWGSLHQMLEPQFSEIQVVPLQGKILPFWRVSERAPFFLQRVFSKDFLWRCEKKSESYQK